MSIVLGKKIQIVKLEGDKFYFQLRIKDIHKSQLEILFQCKISRKKISCNLMLHLFLQETWTDKYISF